MLRPTVAAEHSAVLLAPVLISCVHTMPSLPVNSTMTRHFIPFPQQARFGLRHTTPSVETVSQEEVELPAEPNLL